MAIRPSLLSELKRRNVLRAAALYVGMVWLLAQVITQIGPVFDMPAWVARWFLAASAVGFPFWIALAWFFELTPDGLKRESDVAANPSLRRLTDRKLDRVIIAVLSVAVVMLLTSTFLWHKRAASGDAAMDVVPEKSIAVLPLVNAGGDKGQQYFSDGLSEALIIALSQFDGLKVIGRNSSFQFRDAKDGSADIGRKLGVAHLLEGSVQHAGDQVRISVELIDAASGQTRWSHRYDRQYKDLFALQDEITRAVASALQLKLLASDVAAKQGDRPPGGNIEAYTAYLQGLKYWHVQNFSKAAEYMTRAVQLDPEYALAWAHLSGSLSTAGAFAHDSPEVARDQLHRARIAADKALQLAPGLGAAHAARAYLLFYGFDARGAFDECHRALELAPENGTVLNGCGYVLGGIGKLGEAIRLRQRLLSIEPLYAVNDTQYAKLLAATGRLDEAEQYLQIASRLSSTDWYAQLDIALLRGDADAARAIAGRKSEVDPRLLRALASQVGPDRAAAAQALADVLADPALARDGGDDSSATSNAYKIARIYALRGDAEHALEWLDRSLAQGSFNAFFVLADPLLLRFRDDARFIALCRRLGLPPPSESEALGIDQIRAMQAEKV